MNGDSDTSLLREIHASVTRIEQKAESSWDPAARQTWRNAHHLAMIWGGLAVVTALLGLLAVFVTWALGRVA